MTDARLSKPNPRTDLFERTVTLIPKKRWRVRVAHILLIAADVRLNTFYVFLWAIKFRHLTNRRRNIPHIRFFVPFTHGNRNHAIQNVLGDGT